MYGYILSIIINRITQETCTIVGRHGSGVSDYWLGMDTHRFDAIFLTVDTRGKIEMPPVHTNEICEILGVTPLPNLLSEVL